MNSDYSADTVEADGSSLTVSLSILGLDCRYEIEIKTVKVG